MATTLTEPHRAKKNPIIFRDDSQERRFPDQGLRSRDPGPPGGEPRRGPAEPRTTVRRRRGFVVLLVLVIVVRFGGAIQKSGLHGRGGGRGCFGISRVRWCGGSQFPQCG